MPAVEIIELAPSTLLAMSSKDSKFYIIKLGSSEHQICRSSSRVYQMLLFPLFDMNSFPYVMVRDANSLSMLDLRRYNLIKLTDFKTNKSNFR